MIRRVDATIRVLGKDFQFRLCIRPLQLGDFATIEYPWMDLRSFRSSTVAGNLQACIDHFSASMRALGLGDDWEQQINYVLARCYSRIITCKGMQDVYLDARLGRHVDRLIQLPDAVLLQIDEVVKSRDRLAVQRDLDGVFGRFEPTADEAPLIDEAFHRWLCNGVVHLRKHGSDGLDEFLSEIEYWLVKFRKRSDPWVRNFINVFAYECKAAFNRCFANAWVDLIPWLREHHGLNVTSERFLRFWHAQQQLVAIPYGRTPGGIVSPVHGSVTLIDKNQSGKPVSQAWSGDTEHIGPTRLRDVFSGQVLSLHPLSAFFMQDLDACATAGRFITSPRYSDVMDRGHATLVTEYWDLIGEILRAAHRYRRALDDQKEYRQVRSKGSKAIEGVSRENGDVPGSVTIADFAASLKVHCPNCLGAVRFESCDSPSMPGDQGQVHFFCEACKRVVTAGFTEGDLKKFLFD